MTADVNRIATSVSSGKCCGMGQWPVNYMTQPGLFWGVETGLPTPMEGAV